jgi:hypothetical protein
VIAFELRMYLKSSVVTIWLCSVTRQPSVA